MPACATVIGLTVIVTFAFGWAVWPAWASMLPANAEIIDGARVHLMKFMPTVIANLQMAGFPLSIAKGAQALAAIIVAIFVSGCFRRNPGRLAAAALLVGTFLATPHALLYDMPMVAGAMALFIEARLKTRPTFSAVEVLILVLALMFPVLMTNDDFINFNVPISAVSMLLLFGLILRHEKSEGPADAETGSFGKPLPNRQFLSNETRRE